MLKETSLLNIIHCNSHTRQFCLNESEVTVLVAQSCLTVCDSMDYGLPDSFVHGDSPLSMRFSCQEYWRGLPFPSPGDLPSSEINPRLLPCRQTLYLLSHQEIDFPILEI